MMAQIQQIPTMHEHYSYMLYFNNIKRMQSSITCDLESQRSKIDSQSSNQYWKELWKINKTEDFIAFCDKSHCTHIETVMNTMVASQALADRN